jgi:hypothetical protein
MTADECDFFNQDYCCPPEYIVKAGFCCPSALPIHPGDLTNRCGGSNAELVTEEEWDDAQHGEMK